jgi:hypothetical protein
VEDGDALRAMSTSSHVDIESRRTLAWRAGSVARAVFIAATYSALLTPWKSGDVGCPLGSGCSLSEEDMLRTLCSMQEWRLCLEWEVGGKMKVEARCLIGEIEARKARSKRETSHFTSLHSLGDSPQASLTHDGRACMRDMKLI